MRAPFLQAMFGLDTIYKLRIAFQELSQYNPPRNQVKGAELVAHLQSLGDLGETMLAAVQAEKV